MNILAPELLGLSGLAPGSVAGIRPEALSLAPDDLTVGVLETTVEVVEPLGSETVVYAEVRERPGRVIARLAADFQRAPGEPLRLAFSRSAVHVFGADGVRLVN